MLEKQLVNFNKGFWEGKECAQSRKARIKVIANREYIKATESLKSEIFEVHVENEKKCHYYDKRNYEDSK